MDEWEIIQKEIKGEFDIWEVMAEFKSKMTPSQDWSMDR